MKPVDFYSSEGPCYNASHLHIVLSWSESDEQKKTSEGLCHTIAHDLLNYFNSKQISVKGPLFP